MTILEALTLLKLAPTPQGVRIYGIRAVVYQMLERNRLGLPLDLVSAHQQICVPKYNKHNRACLKLIPTEFHENFDSAIQKYLA